ncbi:ATP-grasp fold amidoligase family protein [Ruminococcus sp.]|uniref:ATP-grasp fold amidoligase family protein n=1 Tax=Ruminococcus sp. TaxID=41978 RepID=UPI00266CB058|nr:ATP-grasp fold amidoligase family protein [uncultured Ruminococcus sp.]
MLEIIKKIFKYIVHTDYRFLVNAGRGRYDSWEDEKFLRCKFKVCLGCELDLDTPKTFNEKLQWLKLYDRKPEYTIMVDKYAVKKYVADKIGEEYIIPTIGVWDSPDEIDFDALPDRFVLKCNHNSGLGMYICRDKSKSDIEKVKAELRRGLAQDYYLTGREWPYKNVVPRILAEKYMEDSTTSELRDYKFFCFNGKPVYCQVISDRTSNETIDFYDMDWQHQSFTGLALPKKPFSNYPVPVPVSFDKMKKSAEILSKGIPFIRVDFYEINGKMYFGELTFYPAAGFGVFSPDEWNYKLGDMINLPDKRG